MSSPLFSPSIFSPFVCLLGIYILLRFASPSAETSYDCLFVLSLVFLFPFLIIFPFLFWCFFFLSTLLFLLCPSFFLLLFCVVFFLSLFFSLFISLFFPSCFGSHRSSLGPYIYLLLACQFAFFSLFFYSSVCYFSFSLLPIFFFDILSLFSSFISCRLLLSSWVSVFLLPFTILTLLYPSVSYFSFPLLHMFLCYSSSFLSFPFLPLTSTLIFVGFPPSFHSSLSSLCYFRFSSSHLSLLFLLSSHVSFTYFYICLLVSFLFSFFFSPFSSSYLFLSLFFSFFLCYSSCPLTFLPSFTSIFFLPVFSFFFSLFSILQSAISLSLPPIFLCTSSPSASVPVSLLSSSVPWSAYRPSFLRSSRSLPPASPIKVKFPPSYHLPRALSWSSRYTFFPSF